MSDDAKKIAEEVVDLLHQKPKTHEQRKQDYFQSVRDRQRAERAPRVQQQHAEHLEAVRKRLDSGKSAKEKQQ